jgi:hypothetical protein
MDRYIPRRAIWMGLFAAILAFGAFTRTTGADHVRAVQIVALIATGMGIGVALISFRLVLGAKKDS